MVIKIVLEYINVKNWWKLDEGKEVDFGHEWRTGSGSQFRSEMRGLLDRMFRKDYKVFDRECVYYDGNHGKQLLRVCPRVILLDHQMRGSVRSES